jgi:hypothetical protein
MRTSVPMMLSKQNKSFQPNPNFLKPEESGEEEKQVQQTNRFTLHIYK